MTFVVLNSTDLKAWILWKDVVSAASGMLQNKQHESSVSLCLIVSPAALHMLIQCGSCVLGLVRTHPALSTGTDCAQKDQRDPSGGHCDISTEQEVRTRVA